MQTNKVIHIGKMIVIILLVIGLGLICINGLLTYIGSTQCLNDPCKMCEDINTDIEIDWGEIKRIENFTLPSFVQQEQSNG